MIQLFINDKDITQDVNIIKIIYIDSCDGVSSDSIEIDFSNTEQDWQKWELQIDSTVRVMFVKDGKVLDTGTLFVDNLELIEAGFKLLAKTMPIKSKTNFLKVWENISLYTVFEEKANELNFDFEPYNTVNHIYSRLEQQNEKDISFLARLSNLEGYTLKIFNKKLILINDEIFEGLESVREINRNEILNKFDFQKSQTGIISEVIYNTKFGKISYKDDNIIGRIKEIYNNYIGSYAEGLRFAKGLLLKNNLNFLTCDIFIDGDVDLSAGNTINLVGFGEYDGKYFISKIINRIDNNFFMQLFLRRV